MLKTGTSRTPRADAAVRRAQQETLQANENLERLISERTAKLQEALAELDAFAYSVSHDLRAPLRSMQGHAHILLEDFAQHLPCEARLYLERIAVNSTRLDQLIQDVLTYSRITRSELKAEPVNLEQMLREILEHCGAFQPPQAEIRVVKPLPQVLGHEGSLVRCLLNLLHNAVKFVAPGVTPRITVRTEAHEGQVRIWVEDNGIGIAPEDLDRIFRLFERIYPESAYEGTGLGLAIVRKAVERMGGCVGVQSQPGQGSRFWLQLPAAA
jgi:signal transduction histidine kinase